MNIGIRIKKVRLSQNRTLQQIANVCGCTKSLLSKIENNKVVPPVATLTKIASALGVKMSAFIEDEKYLETLFVSAQQLQSTPPIKTEYGYSFHTIAAENTHKKMQPFIFSGKKGEVIEHHVSHEGDEYIYIIEGEMNVQIGDITYTMRQGDSIYFNALTTHGVTPVSDEVKYLDIFC